MDKQGTDHDGGYGIAGNSQGHHWNKSATNGRVVGSLGGDKPFHGSFAKGHLRVLGHPFGVIVGHQCRDIAAGTRQRSDNDANRRCLKRQRQVFLDGAE